ncbi:MAG: UDP-N-acetylmuramoyl-tripeptide--D-alanyl-D-alanine ligase [Acidimicrobiales bacterium]
MRFLASEVANAVAGTLVGPDVVVDGAAIDSRELLGGELFVPIIGARDGHDFIAAALERGAAAYLTSRTPVDATGAGPAITVEDTAVALRALGELARSRLRPPVVGITGSVGKTTTKDLLTAVLAHRYRTHASLRSFNNELGVPLTLLNAPDGTEATVVEMGARGHGHIAELCEVARPTIGVVTTVELVHTEMFGDLESVAEAKAELVEALPADGVAVLNADNPFVADMAARTSAWVLTIGVKGEVRATGVEVDGELRTRFELCSPWGSAEVVLGVRGAHNVHNALAAAAVGLACGVEVEAVAEGLGQAEGSPWRMELRHGANGLAVLNDAYNAGPASMEAALHALARLEARRRIAVLGPMAELGDHQEAAHRRVAEVAAKLGIEVLAVGTDDYGVPSVPDVDAAFERLGSLGEGDAVLVKGSRVAGLERLAQLLLAPRV